MEILNRILCIFTSTLMIVPGDSQQNHNQEPTEPLTGEPIHLMGIIPELTKSNSRIERDVFGIPLSNIKKDFGIFVTARYISQRSQIDST